MTRRLICESRWFFVVRCGSKMNHVVEPRFTIVYYTQKIQFFMLILNMVLTISWKVPVPKKNKILEKFQNFKFVFHRLRNNAWAIWQYNNRGLLPTLWRTSWWLNRGSTTWFENQPHGERQFALVYGTQSMWFFTLISSKIVQKYLKSTAT